MLCEVALLYIRAMLGKRLSEVRKNSGDKQADLANRLGVSVSTVRSWEQEKSTPNYEALVSICRFYHISSDFLLGLSDSDSAYMEKQFSEDELEEIKCYEAYLRWKRSHHH